VGHASVAFDRVGPVAKAQAELINPETCSP
jgi:hypothetical protein